MAPIMSSSDAWPRESNAIVEPAKPSMSFTWDDWTPAEEIRVVVIMGRWIGVNGDGDGYVDGSEWWYKTLENAKTQRDRLTHTHTHTHTHTEAFTHLEDRVHSERVNVDLNTHVRVHALHVDAGHRVGIRLHHESVVVLLFTTC